MMLLIDWLYLKSFTSSSNKLIIIEHPHTNITKNSRKNLIFKITVKIIVVTGENTGKILRNSNVRSIDKKMTNIITILHSM